MLWWSVIVSVDFPFNTHYEIVEHAKKYEIGGYEHINQKQHEVFSVPKTNTVIDPRAMMVHV